MIKITIANPVFQDYKRDMDVRLSLFAEILRKLGGNLAYGHGECIIYFPRD